MRGRSLLLTRRGSFALSAWCALGLGLIAVVGPVWAAEVTEVTADPADAVLGTDTETPSADPAGTVLEGEDASPEPDSGAGSAGAPADVGEGGTTGSGDPADAALAEAGDAPTAATPAAVSAASEDGDVAEEVLAEQERAEAATAPEGATEPAGPQELRREIEASVSVRKLASLSDLYEGIVVRRHRKGTKGAPARLGFTGVYRVLSADLPPERSFRLGSHFSFYTLAEGWDDTTQTHLDAVGFFSYSVRPDLEVRIAGVASGHHSGVIRRYGQPALFQTLGDVYLGAKYAREVLPFLWVGGVFDLRFFTKVGSFLLRGDATSLELNAVATLDLYRSQWFELGIPIRVHLNTGYTLDRSANVLKDVALPNASTFGGFGLAAGDSIPLKLAVEILQDPYSYFVEYTAHPVVNQRTGVVQTLSWNRSPQRFTLGMRYNPYENILLDGAVDLSYGLQAPVVMFGQKEPVDTPYRLHFGLTYEWNPGSWEIIDLRGQIVGLVVDADTGEPLGGAVIEYLDSEKYTPQLADPQTGIFRSYKLPPGEVLLKVEAEGYEPVVLRPRILEQERIEEKIFLRRMSQRRMAVGALVGRVIDEDGNPVTAEIRFPDTDIAPVESQPPDGRFVKILPEGTYVVEVRAPGFQPKRYRVPIVRRKKTKVVFQLVSGRALGALAGTVLDEHKRPLQATILFLDAEVPPVDTDATGQFMKILPPGTYTIEIRARGYAPKRYRVPVSEGRKTVLDVQLVPDRAIGALAGRILAADGSPLAGVITFAKPGIAPVPADPETGRFEVVLPAGSYEILVEAPGYKPRRFRIPVLKGKKTVQDFRLEPAAAEIRSEGVRLEGDRILTNEPIRFEPGTALLKESAYPVLEAVAQLFSRVGRGKRLEVVAHTHNLGPSSANLKLSLERARAVKEYLVSIGVPPDRIRAVGKGEEEPIADNSTPEGRAKNERVEFFLR